MSMFADIFGTPQPFEGEELFADGRSIRFGAGLRQIFPGDLIVIEWPVDQSFGTGNWVKGGLVEITTNEASPKRRRTNYPVLESQLCLEEGWQMGSMHVDVTEGRMTLVPQVKMSNIPWSWELRTDDVPGWNLFVVGHNCKLHDDGTTCLADDRKTRADEARARRGEGQERNK